MTPTPAHKHSLPAAIGIAALAVLVLAALAMLSLSVGYVDMPLAGLLRGT